MLDAHIILENKACGKLQMRLKKASGVRLIFLHTTTLGIRESLCSRYTLTRSQRTEETKYGPVRVKTAQGWGVKREKMEYEDLAAIVRREGIALSEIERH